MDKLERFRALLEAQVQAEHYRKYTHAAPVVRIKLGRRWTKIDVGTTGQMRGRYMVDQDGTIYGVKAYGVPHLGHRYGTLDEIESWNWGGYRAVKDS